MSTVLLVVRADQDKDVTLGKTAAMTFTASGDKIVKSKLRCETLLPNIEPWRGHKQYLYVGCSEFFVACHKEVGSGSPDR